MFFAAGNDMRYLAAFLFICCSFGVTAQEYRLVYDSSDIPELYNTMRLALQENTGRTYKNVASGYRLYTSDGMLDGNILTYNDEDLRRTGGRFQLIAEIKGQKIALPLRVPILKDIRFNLYTDSIKPILNFYVNVEGSFTSGKVLPLTDAQVFITSDKGTINGMEWIAPTDKSFDRVTFTAASIADPTVARSVTVYRKKAMDPRDAEGYEEKRR